MRELSRKEGTQHAKMLDAVAVRGTIYAAVRNTNIDTGQSYVLFAVILFVNSAKDGFGYNNLDESLGPFEVNCPNHIMHTLSPIKNIPDPGNAADWRVRVAAEKGRRKAGTSKLGRLVPGCKVRLTQQMHFRLIGVTTNVFTVVGYRKRTPIFAPLSHPHLQC